MGNIIKQTISTDAGMWCIWNIDRFSNILSYEDWEKIFLDNLLIKQLIEQKVFVPINIGSDGSFQFEIKIGTKEKEAILNEREKKYLRSTSKNYCILSNGKLAVSGLEKIGEVEHDIDNVCIVYTDNTEYIVSINLIEWDKEPNMKDAEGFPTKEALPDFIILLNPVDENVKYKFSTELDTFPTGTYM